MTTDKEKDSTVFERMLTTMFDPEIISCVNSIRLLADYDIPQDQRASFLRFHAFITNPQPKYITAWRAEPKLERRWYHRHVNGVLHDVRGALAAAHYHASRLGEIEASVSALLNRSGFRERLANMFMGLGCTRKMDFEYQGFILAYRRCLDYLACALACYFKREPESFRTFPKTIARSKHPAVAAALSQAHMRHIVPLAFVLSEGRKSVRNRIAHYDFVSAGSINLTARGFFLCGGGEDIPLPESPEGFTLVRALKIRLDSLHSCVGDMIDTFISAVRENS